MRSSIKSLLLLVSIFLLGCNEDPSQNAKDRQLEDFEPSPFLWGYIDKAGNFALSPAYDDALDFNEGLAAVNIDGLWGYINEDGDQVIQPQFLSAHSFYNGKARVKNDLGLWGMIDYKGNYLIKPTWSHMDDPLGDLVRVEGEFGFTYIDAKSLQPLDDFFQTASPFENGCAIVSNGEGFSLLQKDGELSGEFQRMIFDAVGLLGYQDEGKWGFVDRNGEVRIPALYDDVTPFIDGHTVATLDEAYLLLNDSNEVVLQSDQELEYLGEGMVVRYSTDESVDLITTDGQVISSGELDEVYGYQNGLAPARIDSLWSFLNTKGELIREPFSTLVWPFKNHHARCIIDGGIGFIDTSGQQIISGKFFEVKDFSSNGLARAQSFR